MLVSDILKNKGNQVWTIAGEQTVQEAIKVMVENKIGALLVLDSAGKVAGVFSERDFLRACNQNAAAWNVIKVEKIMSPRVIMCKIDDTVDYVMSIMTQQRIRHVPVAAEGKLCGIISIGDAVKAQLKATEVEIQYLKDYLHGA